MDENPNTSGELPEERFELNQAQSDLFDADTEVIKTILGTAGEQAGKTSVGVLWLREQVEKYWDEAPYNYIVGANTYKVLKQSTKEKFDEVFTGYMGHYNEKDDYFQLRKEGKTWGRIYFRSQGMDHKSAGDAFIGIPNCKAGLGDEVAKWQRQFYIRFRGRLARLNGAFFGCGTPYALNFIKKEIIKPYEAGDRTIMYRRWTCMDNPSYDPAGIELLKKTYSPTEFNRLVLGIVTKAEGLVHAAWGDNNYASALPIGKPVYVGGIDWGFDHAFATVILGCYPNAVVIESLSKKRGMTPSQQRELIRGKNAMFLPKMWFAGHDEPGTILELSQEKIPIVKYFELKPELREIVPGDKKVSELIANNQLRLLSGIADMEEFDDEIETYKWDREEDEELSGKEKPEDKNNDLMAALRYAVVGVVSLNLLTQKFEKPKIPLGDHLKRDFFKPKSSRKAHWSDS